MLGKPGQQKSQHSSNISPNQSTGQFKTVTNVIGWNICWRLIGFLSDCHKKIQLCLTEPRWAIQPRSTQWFPRIGLFVVQAISLGPCRRPFEFLNSSRPYCRLSKIPNSQIHKVEKLKILSHFQRKDFFIISHEHRNRFL